MAFRTKSVVVDAIQWFPNPQGVEPEGVTHTPGLGHTFSYGGISTKLNPGDWLVTFPEGATVRVDDDVFHEMYEPEPEPEPEEPAEVLEPEPEPPPVYTKPLPILPPKPVRKAGHRKR